MHPNPGPGILVAFEGLDGAGTTTQVRLLAERLCHMRSVWVTHEPSDGPAGLQIRMVLAHRIKTDAATLAALFAADRLDHLYHTDGDRGMAIHLQAGTDVITDRYYVSSFAYQGMNLDWDWLWDMHAPCIRPDVCFFLDVPVDVCLQRIASGRGDHFELFENQAALTGVRQSYLAAIERLRRDGDRIEIIDGSALPDRVHEAIWTTMQTLLAEAR
jgi:dTMP kinase